MSDERYKKERECAFCGGTEDIAGPFLSSGKDNPDGESEICICSRCVKEASKMLGYKLSEETKDMKDEKEGEADISNDYHHTSVLKIIDKLNEYVVGQDKAKLALATAMYIHLVMLQDKTGLIKKSNVMMVGPSGTGKTLLASTLAKIFNLPFAVVDATTITSAGYVGDDVSLCISSLLIAADGDVERAERGIVFIDEIDKIKKTTGNGKDVAGEAVQQALLKMVEGKIVNVPHPDNETGDKRTIPVDTTNILFICAGAFSEIFDEKRYGTEKQARIGFGDEEEKEERNIVVSPDALRKYGMIPEFLGRFPVITQLDELTREDMVRIASFPEDSIIKEYKHIFEMNGKKLVMQEGVIEKVADLAMERNLGARGMRSIILEKFQDAIVDLGRTQHDDDRVSFYVKPGTEELKAEIACLDSDGYGVIYDDMGGRYAFQRYPKGDYSLLERIDDAKKHDFDSMILTAGSTSI